MMFPANFIIESISSIGWVAMNLAFYLLIFNYTNYMGTNAEGGGAWDKYQFFVFLATTLLVNSIVQMFFMPNAEEFSELIRTGELDFALLKPIDTQFLDLAAEGRLVGGRRTWCSAWCCWATRCRGSMGSRRRCSRSLLYPLYVVLGVLILYSLMIAPGGHQRLAGPQPVALRFLVLHHELRPLPDGDLRRPDRQLAALVAHVPAADAGGGQRAGRGCWPSRCQPEYALPGGVRHRGDGRLARRQPLGLSAGAVELSQREQLERKFSSLSRAGVDGVRYRAFAANERRQAMRHPRFWWLTVIGDAARLVAVGCANRIAAIEAEKRPC